MRKKKANFIFLNGSVLLHRQKIDLKFMLKKKKEVKLKMRMKYCSVHFSIAMQIEAGKIEKREKSQGRQLRPVFFSGHFPQQSTPLKYIIYIYMYLYLYIPHLHFPEGPECINRDTTREGDRSSRFASFV